MILLSKKFISYLFLSIFLISCGGGGGEDKNSTTTVPLADTIMVAVDPYIINAQFCFDENVNNSCDIKEQISSFSDKNGVFIFSPGLKDGSKVLMNKSGKHNSEDFTGILKGTVGKSKFVTPLTTLVENGFSEDNIIAILKDNGIVIQKEEIFQNPMKNINSSINKTSDISLMKANLSVHSFLDMVSYDTSKKEYDKDVKLQEIFKKNISLVNKITNKYDEKVNSKIKTNIAVSVLNYINIEYKKGNESLINKYEDSELLQTHLTSLKNKYSKEENKYFKIIEKDEVKKEDEKKDEVKKEDEKKDEVKKEDEKKDEVKKEEDEVVVEPVTPVVSYNYKALDNTGNISKNNIRINGINYTLIVYSSKNISSSNVSTSSLTVEVKGDILGKSFVPFFISYDYSNEKLKLKVFKSLTTFNSSTNITSSNILSVTNNKIIFSNMYLENKDDYSAPISKDTNIEQTPNSPVF